MPRALITGITGQDGHYLAERLRGDGLEVHALVLGADGEDVPAYAVPHRADVTDTAATRAVVDDVAPEEVYNLAALSSVAESWERPDATAATNGLAAVALLESAHRVQERTGSQVRFVQASSAEIFGDPAVSPQDEDTPVRPVNPYGAAKAYAHLAVEVYRRRGLHAVATILYNHESPRRPERFVTRKITSTVAAISLGRADRLVLGNLDVRRDWGWAPDYVDAMVRAARAGVPRDYVVATGESRSVRDFVATAFDHVGIDDWERFVEVDPAFVRAVDAAELVGDASRARAELGWRPTVSFAEMVGRLVDADLARLSGG